MLQLEKIASDLNSQGYAIVEEFCSAVEVELLIQDLQRSFSEGDFHQAAIGRGQGEHTQLEIRNDSICWFQPETLSEAQGALWQRLAELQSSLNQSLLLGLWEIEGHYARYPAGGFYQRHLDRFRDSDTRVLSVVLYLNKDWRVEDGGQLFLFPAGLGTVAVEPTAGKLICFLSGDLEHKVQPSLRPRLSFAGWFRRRA